ncbi:MAG TPA: aminotransferase class V-fold PLP-dependent enzyme [Chloroflexota bacterium]|jgi:selenocysteine lyase/cysteine desulfurase
MISGLGAGILTAVTPIAAHPLIRRAFVGRTSARFAEEVLEANFRRRFPEYAVTRAIDTLRTTEYRRLDQGGHTYLDYTGGGVYAESQLREHQALLSRRVFGNPHSGNPASLAMTELVELTRATILNYFRAPPEEYVVVFTTNATGALRLVGEGYPFGSAACYLLSVDNHNSVNGIREFARRRGADVRYVPLTAPELRLDEAALVEELERRVAGPKLFAYPAQSNFSGVQHALGWVDEAKRRGWDVLLDAASFVPTNQLDLSACQPDFVPVSFYKLFGYPTGIGCLIARKEALARLRRPWFAGGTITFSSVRALDDETDGYYLSPGAAGFEDGTINYLSVPAVTIGLRWLDQIGVDLIRTRVRALTAWLLDKLQTLLHANGRPVVRVYGPRDHVDRGATIAVNMLDAAGTTWDCWEVERLANRRNLSLRSGCHCNPGAREVALGFEHDELAACFEGKDQLSYGEFLRRTRPSTQGVVRVSLGVASTFHDVYRLLEFAKEFVDRPAGRMEETGL